MRIYLLIFLFLSLTSCGQYGKLYLPEPSNKTMITDEN